MRWARQQDGVIQGPATFDQPFGREYVWGWYADGQTVRVNITWGIGFIIALRGPRVVRIEQGIGPAEVLRVLAALDLIPNELAEPGERYARCEKCRLICRWDEGHGLWEPRWLHTDPIEAWSHGPHHPEVA